MAEIFRVPTIARPLPPRRTMQEDQQGSPRLLLDAPAPPASVPFCQHDWPTQQRRTKPVALLTHLDWMELEQAIAIGTPFRQQEWPLPIARKPVSSLHEGCVGTGAFAIPLAFDNTDPVVLTLKRTRGIGTGLVTTLTITLARATPRLTLGRK